MRTYYLINYRSMTSNVLKFLPITIFFEKPERWLRRLIKFARNFPIDIAKRFLQLVTVHRTLGENLASQVWNTHIYGITTVLTSHSFSIIFPDASSISIIIFWHHFHFWVLIVKSNESKVIETRFLKAHDTYLLRFV